MTDLLSTMTRPRYAGPNRRFRRTSSVVKDSSRTSSLALNAHLVEDANRLEVPPTLTYKDSLVTTVTCESDQIAPTAHLRLNSDSFNLANVQTKV